MKQLNVALVLFVLLGFFPSLFAAEPKPAASEATYVGNDVGILPALRFR